MPPHAELKWPPTPTPAAPAEPGVIDRAALAAEVKAADEAFDRRRPVLEHKLREARKVAEIAAADSAAAKLAGDRAEAALLAAQVTQAYIRGRLVGKLLADPPAALVEAKRLVSAHRRELLNQSIPVGNPAEFARVGRRAAACVAAGLALDVLAALGLDGAALDAAIRGVFVGVDVAEAAEPAGPPPLAEPAKCAEDAWQRLCIAREDTLKQSRVTAGDRERLARIGAALDEIKALDWWLDSPETRAAVRDVIARAKV